MRDNSIRYTLTTPQNTLTFDPLDARSTWYIEDCSFHAGVATEVVSRPQAHGSYQDPGRKEGGVWSAQIRVYGGDVALETNRTSLAKALNSSMGEDGGASLAFTPQGSTYPQTLSGMYLADESWVIDGNSWLVHAQFATPRPFAEDTTAVTSDSTALTSGGGGFVIPLTIPVTFLASTGGVVTVTNYGDYYAYPVLRVYGPITAPRVTNTTRNLCLNFPTGSIAAGDYWEISLFDQTVKLNGVTTVTTLDPLTSDWFYLGYGASSLQLTGASYSSSTFLRAYMKSAWA